MYGRIFLILTLLFFGLISPIYAEVISIQAGVNVFNDPRGENVSYVEFPFSVERSQFEFAPMEGESWLRSITSADLYLTDTLGNRIDSSSTYFYSRADNLQDASRSGVSLNNKLTLYIRPGLYKAVLDVTDVISGKTGSFLYDQFEIKPLNSDSLCLSDIELARSILLVIDSSILNTSRFIKNGYEIIPQPMGIFNKADNYIYIYAELYNLKYSPTISDSFILSYQIYRDDGELYFDYGEMTINKPGSSAVITNKIDFSSWAPGKYKLKLTATDISNQYKSSSEVRFTIIPPVELLPENVISKFDSPLDTASLETKSNWIRFIIDASEWEMFETLNETGKSNFVQRHFSDRDPSPDTKRNEYLLDVIDRFNYAAVNFSSIAGLKNGWSTDRGRILLRYGLCDEIKNASPPAVTKPIQVWYYYSLQGGVYFVFEDSRGYGNYLLVHSTAKGEIYSGGWDELINNYEMNFD